jgi:hypothetical protein
LDLPLISSYEGKGTHYQGDLGDIPPDAVDRVTFKGAKDSDGPSYSFTASALKTT